MKTVNTDLGQFLKRLTAANANTPASLTVLHDGKVFIVKCGDDSARSAYLDDALENLAEHKRRTANGMDLVRDAVAEANKIASAYLLKNNVAGTATSTLTPPAYPQTIKFNINLTPPAPQYPTCPKCQSLPSHIQWNPSFFLRCACGEQWTPPRYVGMILKGSWGDCFSWNGNSWSPVTP